MSVPLKASVQSIEGETIKLTLDDGQTLNIPANACEGVPKVGQDLWLLAAVPGAEDAGRQAISQHLLNQLLGSPKPPSQ